MSDDSGIEDLCDIRTEGQIDPECGYTSKETGVIRVSNIQTEVMDEAAPPGIVHHTNLPLSQQEQPAQIVVEPPEQCSNPEIPENNSNTMEQGGYVEHTSSMATSNVNQRNYETATKSADSSQGSQEQECTWIFMSAPKYDDIKNIISVLDTQHIEADLTERVFAKSGELYMLLKCENSDVAEQLLKQLMDFQYLNQEGQTNRLWAGHYLPDVITNPDHSMTVRYRSDSITCSELYEFFARYGSVVTVQIVEHGARVVFATVEAIQYATRDEAPKKINDVVIEVGTPQQAAPKPPQSTTMNIEDFMDATPPQQQQNHKEKKVPSQQQSCPSEDEINELCQKQFGELINKNKEQVRTYIANYIGRNHDEWLASLVKQGNNEVQKQIQLTNVNALLKNQEIIQQFAENAQILRQRVRQIISEEISKKASELEHFRKFSVQHDKLKSEYQQLSQQFTTKRVQVENAVKDDIEKIASTVRKLR